MKFLKLFEEFTQEGRLTANVCGIPTKLSIASTDDEMKRGYMFSDGPKEGEGMLFVYQYEQPLSFWMKNVKVPLDILFFDSSRNLVDYQSMEPYIDGGEETYYESSLPAQFAVELPSGWISKYYTGENKKLEF